jgi:hypothetical protein
VSLIRPPAIALWFLAAVIAVAGVESMPGWPM